MMRLRVAYSSYAGALNSLVSALLGIALVCGGTPLLSVFFGTDYEIDRRRPRQRHIDLGFFSSLLFLSFPFFPFFPLLPFLSSAPSLQE